MNLIDETVKEEFCKWAGENENKHVFPEISKEEKSYYAARNLEHTYMMEYSFKTAAELRKLLEEYSDLAADSQILRMLSVEIYKNRYDTKTKLYSENSINESQKEESQAMELPEFVYIF